MIRARPPSSSSSSGEGGTGGAGGAGASSDAVSTTKSSSRPVNRTSTEPRGISVVISAAAWEMASIRASRADGSRAIARRSAAALMSGPPASDAATRSRRRLSTYGVSGAADNLTRVTVDGSSNNGDYLRVTVGAPGTTGAPLLSWQRVRYTS